MSIHNVAVIGAGVMGSGIAAQIANAGVSVSLIDIVPEDATNRNIITKNAIKTLLKARPAPLMHKRFSKSIRIGNLEDDLDLIAEADWIIEVVIERLDIKQGLYKKIDSVRKEGSIVSSNTSTLPLAELTQGMPETFTKDFLITHFFNPPRYMRLLEVVAKPDFSPQTMTSLECFCDKKLGKGIVQCNDTPGFIANRIGIYWLQTALQETIRLGLSVEEADAIGGRPMGIPKTGIFGLMDLVGIDLIPHILDSMSQYLPTSDPFHQQASIPNVVTKMIAEGYTGRKGKGGFYRLNKSNGKRTKESIDLKTGIYATSTKPQLESLKPSISKDLQKLLCFEDKGGELAWSIISKVLCYCANLVPEISNDISAIDRAMKLGYNWKYGPFELLDKIGVDWFIKKLETENLPVPALLAAAKGKSFYRYSENKNQCLLISGDYQNITTPEGVLLLKDIKQSKQPIFHNASSSLWDIGDGVVCLEFHSKMNALDPDILKAIETAIDVIPTDYKALVIYNEGSNYSVGANIGLALFTANIAAWPQIEQQVEYGQNVYKRMKYAPFPVVGAPFNMALGGGCESLLHCDAIQAHAETYMGLVEVGVGLLPAWGGTKEMTARWLSNPKRAKGPMPAISKAFEIISTATVSTSAIEAKDSLYLSASDGITMNRDRLLFDAKAKALSMVKGYTPPEAPEFSLPGETARTALNLAVDSFVQSGKASKYDAVIADQVVRIISGGETDSLDSLSEDDMLALEVKAFMVLIKNEETLDRVQHMLETGKPLRN